jgi:hypothetical protein
MAETRDCIRVVIDDELSAEAAALFADAGIGEVRFATAGDLTPPDEKREHGMYSIDFGELTELMIYLSAAGSSLLSIAASVAQLYQLRKLSGEPATVKLFVNDKEVRITSADVDQIRRAIESSGQ